MEVKESKVEMDDSVNKEIGIEKSLMRCTSNFEDHSFYSVDDDLSEDRCGVTDGDDASVKKEVEDDEVDILGFNGNDEIEVSKCDDGTDGYSSSFGGTVSEHESEIGLNDQEADSMSCNDTSLPFWVRKKKLADHWRRFIQPITWRCKWIELKVKEFQKQALKYDKEIEESCQAKKLELEKLKSEEVGVKALSPLPCFTHKNQLKKRKRRKRVEETSDVPSFALNHNLFSYDECRKSFADALNDNSRNLDKRNKSSKDETLFCEEIPPLELREGDAYLEQILLKIEAAKSEARNLKIRVDKVLSENPCRFSPVNTLNLLGSADALTSSEQQKPQLIIETEDEEPIVSEEKPAEEPIVSEEKPVEEPIVSEEKPVESASVSSPDETPEDDETTDILLSEILASTRRDAKAKAIVLDEKLKKTEQASVEEGPSRDSVEEGPSRPARKRTQRNREIMTREETKPKRQRVSREKPKSNVMMASRFKLPNRKRKRGKRRSGSNGLRRRS
ncbi:hypothetical protein V5N11_016823 [Cardamine amara subsp. amara]|uniref:Uncharacterized protein n=1 Tax=Cardamine amara subsp. amara TaxID=228776 RepID=A0ABD0Z6W4_CARAN